MYAIIESGGRQVRAVPGGTIAVDRLAGGAGESMTFDRVLLVEKDTGEIIAGAPCVPNARVVGVIDGELRGPKIRVFKTKRRKGMRRTKGHRAVLTRVRIAEIIV